MKNAIIFHGGGETPGSFWYQWLKKELEKKRYTVSVPLLPDSEDMELSKWLPIAIKENYNSNTTLIGHSAGSPLILSVLERINVKIKQAILVAGFALPLKTEESKKILQKKYNWEKIKGNCEEFIFINSDNDPWGCNDKQGGYMLDHLDGKLIVPKGEGYELTQAANKSAVQVTYYT